MQNAFTLLDVGVWRLIKERAGDPNPHAFLHIKICHICDIKHACFPVTDFEVILASMTYFFIGHLNRDEAKFSAVLKQREQFIHYMLTIMICKISEETKPNYHIQFRPVDDADHLVYGKKEFRTACC